MPLYLDFPSSSEGQASGQMPRRTPQLLFSKPALFMSLTADSAYNNYSVLLLAVFFFLLLLLTHEDKGYTVPPTSHRVSKNV